MRAGKLRERIGAGCFAACLQFFLAEQVARLGWVGRYSMRWNFISNLGDVHCAFACSRWHIVMNGSFFLQGVLIAGAALLLPRRVSPGWAGLLSRLFLLFAAVGTIWIARVPEDVNMNSHITGASLYFVASTLAALFWGLSGVGRRRCAGGGAGVALVCAALCVAGDLLLALGGGTLRGILGPGLIERFAAYPFILWMGWTGVRLLRVSKGEV